MSNKYEFTKVIKDHHNNVLGEEAVFLYNSLHIGTQRFNDAKKLVGWQKSLAGDKVLTLDEADAEKLLSIVEQSNMIPIAKLRMQEILTNNDK